MLVQPKVLNSLIPAATGLALSCQFALNEPNNRISVSNPAACQESPDELEESTLAGNNLTGGVSWKTIQELQRLFDIKNRASVFFFLNEPTATLLINAQGVITRYFDYSNLQLKLVHDWEDGGQTLHLTIFSRSGWEESEEQLDVFDRQWWLAQKWLPSSKSVCIDVYPA